MFSDLRCVFSSLECFETNTVEKDTLNVSHELELLWNKNFPSVIRSKGLEPTLEEL